MVHASNLVGVLAQLWAQAVHLAGVGPFAHHFDLSDAQEYQLKRLSQQLNWEIELLLSTVPWTHEPVQAMGGSGCCRFVEEEAFGFGLDCAWAPQAACAVVMEAHVTLVLGRIC